MDSIKSRYEVIAELEKKKRSLILERDSLEDQLKRKEKDIKIMKREVEDAEEEIENFSQTMESQKETIKELILSVDESLERLSNLDRKK